MPQIKLYQFPPVADQDSVSPFCVKAQWALRYKRLKYDVVNLTTPLSVRKLNRRGKMPFITYDSTTVPDSTEIVAFLERHHPEPRLYPAEEPLRSHALLLEDWADESLYWHVVYERWLVDEQFAGVAKQIFAALPAPVRPVVKLLARRQVRGSVGGQGLGRLQLKEQRDKLVAILNWLSNILDGTYVCGADLTVADIAIGSQVGALTLPLTPFAASEIKQRQRIAGWLERVRSACA